MKICFISGSYGKYGSELSLLELLCGLKDLGVILLVILPKNGPIVDVLDEHKIEWKIVPFPKWRSRPRPFIYRLLRNIVSPLSALRIALIIKSGRYDLVYTNTTVTSVGAMAAYIANRPHIWHSHESELSNTVIKYDLPFKWVMKIIERTSESLVVVSHSLQKYYEPYLELGKLRVIY